MVLSDDNIISFQKLYKERFGKDLSKEDAYEQGIKLLQLMSLVYRPMTRAEFEVIQARQFELLRNQK
jgi:hypothetical protein